MRQPFYVGGYGKFAHAYGSAISMSGFAITKTGFWDNSYGKAIYTYGTAISIIESAITHRSIRVTALDSATGA